MTLASTPRAQAAATIEADAPTAEVMPWTFHDPERFRARLESAGFLVERVEWFPRLTKVPTGVRGWLETFGTALLAPLDEPTRQLVFGEVESLLRPSLACDDGSWFVDYVRLRFVATLAA